MVAKAAEAARPESRARRLSIGGVPSEHHREGYGLTRAKASQGKIAPAMVAGFT
jgi:hypothetical protein